jgi:cell division protein FtsI (penicillin-binding protein 3)
VIHRGWHLVMGSNLLLQTSFYNAVANNGEMVKTTIWEIKEWNKSIKKYDIKVINPKFVQTKPSN